MATIDEYQKKVRNLAVPAVYAIIWNSMDILMMLRQNTGYMDGMWDLPAGHIEAGELPTEALSREVREEVGLRFSKWRFSFAHMSYRPKHDQTGDRVDLFFEAEILKSEVPIIGEPDKCAQILWMNARMLPENTVPQTKKGIECWRHKVPFSELGFEWLKENGEYKL